MTDKPNLDYQLLVYSDQYKLQTLSLLKLLWTQLTDEQANAYFNWRYQDNPFSKSPLIVICVYEEQVIGVLGHMVQKVTINDSVENVCIPVDGIVLSEYRRFGVYSRMLEEGVKLVMSLMPVYAFKLYFNASSNVRSAIGLLNLGWKLLGPKMYMTKISVINILKSRMFEPSCAFRTSRFRKKKSDFTFEVSNEIRFEDLERIEYKKVCPVSILHDREFFAWRYSCPRENYHFVYLYKDSVLVSYLVICKGSKYQYSIEEYGCKDNDSLATIISCMTKHMNIQILRLFFLHLPKDEMRTLAKAGFIVERLWVLKLFKKARSSVYFRHILENRSEADYLINGIDTMNVNNWKLFHGDIL